MIILLSDSIMIILIQIFDYDNIVIIVVQKSSEVHEWTKEVCDTFSRDGKREKERNSSYSYS